ncbi:hypothetical protein PVT67_09800 [Gallaecimonas kandeliae]|uniref:hypothetical protein n=1 Tax=Gallaecimonas kandeliae TaxID=3029055 RepID=UPI00264726A3|nr:hypothetical protein [Gallaecimonas kandeliae]WKE63992.1 hypothetical protein PVT67_09800 [Gallaecimonas kandeliae]
MRAWLLLIALTALLALRLLLGVHPSSQLADLLPDGFQGAPAGERASFKALRQRFDRQLWLLAEGQNPGQLVALGRKLGKSLDAASFVAGWQGGDSDAFKALGRYRGQLLADSDRALPDQSLLARAQALWFGPMPSSLRLDPLLSFSHFLEQQRPRGSQLHLVGGWPLWRQGDDYALVLSVTLKGSAYDGQVQAAVKQWLGAQPQAVKATGTVLYAAAGARQAQVEVSRFGTLAALGVLALIWWGFGGWRALGYMGGLLLASGLGALTALWWCFPGAHWLALVMGASVIGICADYGFHRLAAGPDGSAIHKPLLLGLLSSLAAYGVLSLSPFPGLAQLGVTAIGGLLVAYGYVRFVAKAPAVPVRTWPARLMARLEPRRTKAAWALALLLLAWLALGVSRLSFDDDIRQWQPKDPALSAVEARLGHYLGVLPGGQYLLLQGKDVQELLQKEEALAPRLEALEAKGQLAGYLALSQAVPSKARQQADHQRLAGLWQQLDAQLGGALGQAPALDAYLLPGALPAFDARRQLLLEGTKPATVMVLRGLTPAGQAALGDQRLISPALEASRLFSHYRDQILKLLGLAFLALAPLLWWLQGKKAGPVLASAGAAVLAAAMAPAMLGQAFNLVHALALVLVLGLSLDYGLFFAGDPKGHHSLLATLLSALSSLLAFGLLIASSTPVLVGFGAVVTVGLFTGWWTSLLWAGKS